MKLSIIILGIICVSHVRAIPLVLRETSPSGDSIVAISTSDSSNDGIVTKENIDENGKRISSVSVVSTGKGPGNGRSFASASSSSGQPFLVPFFISPFQGFPINDWVRNVESFYDPNFAGQGESITAINDNGHIYGEINGVPFDNSAKNES